MPLVTLEQARAHLRADANEDVELYVGAAEQHAQDFLNRKVYEDVVELNVAVAEGSAGDAPMVANDAIRAAILLIVGHLYANREEVITGTIATRMPMGATSLLFPHRVGLGA